MTDCRELFRESGGEMFPVKKKPETDPENPQADQPEEEVYCEDQELEE